MLAENMGADNASSRKTTPNVSDAEMDENDEYEPDENSDDDEGMYYVWLNTNFTITTF